MTHRELLMKHLNKYNATILMVTKNLVMWQYKDVITIDEFDNIGNAIGRNCRKIG